MKLLKIDEFTLSLSIARYDKVFLELDLARPLSRDFWMKDGDTRVFESFSTNGYLLFAICAVWLAMGVLAVAA